MSRGSSPPCPSLSHNCYYVKYWKIELIGILDEGLFGSKLISAGDVDTCVTLGCKDGPAAGGSRISRRISAARLAIGDFHWRRTLGRRDVAFRPCRPNATASLWPGARCHQKKPGDAVSAPGGWTGDRREEADRQLQRVHGRIQATLILCGSAHSELFFADLGRPRRRIRSNCGRLGARPDGTRAMPER